MSVNPDAFYIPSTIQYVDGSFQNTAYIPHSVTAGSYTNPNITVNSQGQITAITNTTFTITSNTGTNAWSFLITGQSYGTIFSYQLYSPVANLTTTSQTGLTFPMNFGAVGNNGSLIFASGNGMYQPISVTTQNLVTYCAGFQQDFTASRNGFGYCCNISSMIPYTITSTTTAGTVTENNGTCPPSANGYPGCYLNFFSSTAIASCALTMQVTIIV
jgi:hypothetical protein